MLLPKWKLSIRFVLGPTWYLAHSLLIIQAIRASLVDATTPSFLPETQIMASQDDLYPHNLPIILGLDL